jgi:hypothetical protein
MLLIWLYFRHISITFAANEIWADTETAKENDEEAD